MTASSPRLIDRLRVAARGVRRALWRHVGRFVVDAPPRLGRLERPARAVGPPLRLVKTPRG